MADDVTLPGTGQAVAADDISNAKYQRIKLIHGADGVNDGDVSSANPLPTLEAAIAALIGEVQASPTSNTVLDRLKALLTGIVLSAGDNNIGNVDLASAIPAGDNVIGRTKISDGTEVASVNVSNQLEVAEANSAAIKTAVELLDNIVNSGRAEANLISGQTGITAGAGAVSASTPRTTLASDDPAVTHLASIITLVGEVQASPSANTILARVKDLLTGIVLNTGSNAIGKLAANSGVDIGDVDVTTLPGTVVADIGNILTALQIIDDWDESDRVKANLIVGQIGITAGAGAVAANTPRVTLTSNDPAVAALEAIDAGKVEETTFTGRLGEVQASPTSNTILARLKDLLTGIVLAAGSAIIGKVGIDQTTPGTTNGVQVNAALPVGTNAIGKLVANSGVDIGDVDVISQPARDRATDNQGVALQTDALMNDTTVLTPQYAVIAASSSGDNTLVAAVVGKKIRVLGYSLVCAAAVTVRLEDGAGGSALSGQMEFAANSGIVLPFNPLGWFETTANTLLNLELSGAISAAGHLTYVEV